ncbi:MAG: hypothetical protein KY462_00715 [Actinobacteria bacterium]|nr:hypothetical protein [Actinomycetota bacterium]
MGADDVLVVTTRSKLRSARFFPQMMLASTRIRRQLGRTEGVVRWASVVASPTEFWTITVWRSRHLMQEFMRSEEHGDIMWLFSKWLGSFWLMRWRPGQREHGAWSDLTMSRRHTGGDAASEHGTRAERELVDEMFAKMPYLRVAMGDDGVASYRDAPHVQQHRKQVEGAGGAIVRIETSPLRTPVALAELRRHRDRLRSSPSLLGAAAGVGRAGEAYLLAVWSDRSAGARLIEGGWARDLRRRWGDGYWACEWLPENEFGHWDGRRLRRELRRHRGARSRASTAPERVAR